MQNGDVVRPTFAIAKLRLKLMPYRLYWMYSLLPPPRRLRLRRCYVFVC